MRTLFINTIWVFNKSSYLY